MNMNCSSLRFSALFAFCVGAWMVASQTSPAAEFRAEDRSVVEADEVIDDDLYIFGEEVTIDGDVKGDVFAFGRVIRVNGSITGDLFSAGQAIVISGHVGDDVRIAGQALRIDEEAVIGDDVLAAGLSFEADDASSVGGDWIFAGYQALLAGDIDGLINGSMANCEINGHVGGDVKLSVDGDGNGVHAYTGGSPPPISMPSLSEGLTIGDSAQIDGGLKYESKHEAKIDGAAKITGDIEHTLPPVQVKKAGKQAANQWDVVSKHLALLVIGLCVVLFAPAWTRGLSDRVKTQPLASFGLGFAGIAGLILLLFVILAGMVAVAVIAGLVKLTSLVPVALVLGISSVAVLGVGFWFFTSYLATIVLSFFTGNLLLARISPRLAESRFLSLVIGLVVLAGISCVPYLGSIVAWLVVLIGLGALLLWMFTKRPESAAPAIEKAVVAG